MDETAHCLMKNTDSDVQFIWCLIGVSLEISQDRDLLEMYIENFH